MHSYMYSYMCLYTYMYLSICMCIYIYIYIKEECPACLIFARKMTGSSRCAMCSLPSYVQWKFEKCDDLVRFTLTAFSFETPLIVYRKSLGSF